MTILVACGGTAPDAGAELETRGESGRGAAPSAPPYLAAMVDAPERTAYRGIREVEIVAAVGGRRESLTYSEEVGSRGDGHFAVVPLEVLSPDLGPEQEQLFLYEQASRDGLVYRFRDFRVRDVERFLANYRHTLVAPADVVAGVRCLRFRAQRRVEPAHVYEVWVERSTGLVLRWELHDSSGALLVRSAFVSFAFDAVVDDMPLRENLFPALPLDAAQPLQPQVGFELLEPTSAPPGYVLASADSFVGPEGRPWLRRIYDDGVDRLAFLQSQPAGGGLPDGRSLGPVDVVDAGSWSVVTGHLRRSQVILLGRVASHQLLDMLQSAVPAR